MVIWDDVVRAVTTSMGPDEALGRTMLDDCWAATADDDHAQRCVLAHYLADRQAGLDDEIAWDETALRHFAHVGDTDLAAIGIPSAAGLAPSLHLNLGDGYLRRGDLAAAREQLAAAQAAAGVLADDGYGQMIRRGIDGLAERVGAIDR